MFAALFAILVSLCSGPSAVFPAGGTAADTAVEEVARILPADGGSTVDSYAELAACCMECNCDLSLPSPYRSVARGIESPAPQHAAARWLRTAPRIVFCDASHGYSAGRVTRLFEFDLFRSLLRADFFLHSLCRLRI